MPLLLVFVLVLTVGVVVGFVAWRYPRVATQTPSSTIEAAREVGKTARRHPRLRALLAARLDPETATGLALTVAMMAVIAGGVVFAVLAYLIRTNAHLLGIDSGVAKWGNRHATATSTRVLNDLTQLGSIYVVVGLCVVLAIAETLRQRSVWVPLFIVAVMGGEEIVTLSVKQLEDRVRPSFNPVAATLGPSFPSGHSATAAAFYATAALLIGRWRPRRTRAVVVGPRCSDRGRGCSEPRPARRALADGRDRRALYRLGVVRGVRDRLRRTNSALRCCGRDGRPGCEDVTFASAPRWAPTPLSLT